MLKHVEAYLGVMHDFGAVAPVVRGRLTARPSGSAVGTSERTLIFEISEALEHVVAEVAMQVFPVHRVQRVFHDLQPVARNDSPADVPDYVVADKWVPARHQRYRLRAQISKHQSAQFLDRIGFGSDASFKGAFRRLRGHFQTLSSLIKQPSVIGAAKPLVLRDAVDQVDAPVRAGLIYQP